MTIETSTFVAQIAEEWKQQGIKAVAFEIPDLAGMPRSKLIPLQQLQTKAQQGINMYGGTVTVDAGSNLVPETLYNEERRYADSVLIPDLQTASVLPWYKSIARVICDLSWGTEGQKIPAAPRTLLKELISAYDTLGYRIKVGLEYEFYLFQPDYAPLFNDTHIFNTAHNLHTPAIIQIMELLPLTGIEILTANCEYGPGQYEITYEAQDALTAADQGYTFKQGVKAIAEQNGLHASFMTKPYPDFSACGGHLHISLYAKDSDRNLFLDRNTNDRYGLTPLAYQFTQGLLTHAPASMAMLAPTQNCYQRFQHHSFAPTNISAGIDDRSAMIRIKNSFDEHTHIEHRLPTSMSNSYLAIAAVLSAGLCGLQEGRTLERLFEGPGEEDEQVPTLPTSLTEALDAFEQDEHFLAHFAADFAHIYPRVKRNEIQRQQQYIQEHQEDSHAALTWEKDEYLAAY